MKSMTVKESHINGVGVFADERIEKDEKISFIRGPLVVVRDFTKLPAHLKKISDDWIGISRYRYIDTQNSLFRFLNHSCDSNSALTTPRTLVARRVIEIGEEITMDYSFSEAGDDFYLGRCTCDSAMCRVQIEPIQKLSEVIFNSHMPYTAKNFQRIYWAMNKKG